MSGPRAFGSSHPRRERPWEPGEINQQSACPLTPGPSPALGRGEPKLSSQGTKSCRRCGERSSEGGGELPIPESRVSLFSRYFSARSMICASGHGLAPSPWHSPPTQETCWGRGNEWWDLVTQGAPSGDGGPESPTPGGSLGYRLTPRCRGSIRMKRPPAASQMSSLQKMTYLSPLSHRT